MKKTRIITAIAALMLLNIFQVTAQRRGNGDCNFDGKRQPMAFLDLSEEQEAQVKTIFSERQAETVSMRLDVEAKEIELKKLMIEDQIDEKAVFAKVDEIGQLKAEIRKVRLEGRIEIRALLTDEQKALFDARGPKAGKGDKRRGGRGQGQGRGQGRM